MFWWLSPGEELDDAVGINCKKGTPTEYQGAEVKYMGKGVSNNAQLLMMSLDTTCCCHWTHPNCCFHVDDYVCVIRLDMTTLLGGGRKSWYIIIIVLQY